jgi:hypothetical protein
MVHLSKSDPLRQKNKSPVEKTLKLGSGAAEKFYALYRKQYNPDLSVPNSLWKNGLPSELRSKEKEKGGGQAQRVHDWTFAEKAKRNRLEPLSDIAENRIRLRRLTYQLLAAISSGW